MFHEMAKHISVATTILMDPKTAPAEIDRCLTAMLQESRPCYIGVPVDMSHLPCDSERLNTPLQTALAPNDAAAEEQVVKELRDLLEKKSKPIIIVDGNANRNNLTEECAKLCKLTGLPTFTTCMGKGGTNEESPNFGGVYGGVRSVFHSV